MEFDINAKLSSMVDEAQDLYKRSKLLQIVPGSCKLKRKIHSELKCLLKLGKGLSKDSLDNHLKSTNLTNLRAVIKAIENSPDVISILQTFFYESDYGEENVIVDAVVTGGYKWIKIISRKPLAVHNIMKGEGNYGDKDMVTLASEYLLAADQNPIHFEPPDICFVFPRGITQSVYDSLKLTGVHPIGEVLPDPDFDDLSVWKELEIESNLKHINDLLLDFTIRCTIVNLDVSTLIVLTSNITNGECNYEFKEKILAELAAEEQKGPALPELQKFLNNKKLVCCQTAYDNFQKILFTVGGPNEKERSLDLFKTVEIVPDNPSSYATDLEESKSIKLKSKIIFGTGEYLQAITCTANSAFVRAATNQGVRFSAYFHPSRALSEQKQPKTVACTE